MEVTRQRVNPTVDSFPYKVELHVHLDGAIRIATLLDVAKRRNIESIQHKTVDELRREISVYHAKSMYKVLASFGIFMPVIAGDRDAISITAYEFCEDCSRNNIRYVEARYSPHLLASNEAKPEYALQHGDLTPKEVVQLVNEAFVRGSRDFNIRANTILCCMRHRSDWSEEVVDLAHEYRNDGVVAIDIAGGSGQAETEEIDPSHKKAFNSLDELHAERIGHGYHSVDDPAVYADVIRRQVLLEACPISSICTGAVPEDIHKHPVVRYAHDGVNFCLNSDDPLLFDSCLLDDYNSALDMGLTRQDIIQSIFNAANSCFAEASIKADVLHELSETYGKKYLRRYQTDSEQH